MLGEHELTAAGVSGPALSEFARFRIQRGVAVECGPWRGQRISAPDAGFDPVPAKGVGVAPRLSETSGEVPRGGASHVGTHTGQAPAEVLGYDDERLSRLREQGTIA